MNANSKEVAMLKTLLLATALLSSSAFAYDQADRDARLGRLVDSTSVVAYQTPVECDEPAPSDEPTTFIWQPAAVEPSKASYAGERTGGHQPQRVQSRGARYGEGKDR